MKTILSSFFLVTILLLAGCGSSDNIQKDISVVKVKIDKTLAVTGEDVVFSTDTKGSKYEWCNDDEKLINTKKSFSRAF